MRLDDLTPAAVRDASIEELCELGDEIRRFLVDSVARTGGHIGANLGTVDLTLALHRVFESPRDTIIWDTGHQGYTHKIVTGRAAMFPTLNTYGGMSRFVTHRESEHDAIDASHGGTSISIALGIALARRVKGDDGHAVAVIGDGSLCEGLALEALNHASVERDTRLVVVLNDNGFAISPGFGGLHEYLQSRRPGDTAPETLFTSLAYAYIGAVDGHDLGALIDALERAKRSERVPLVHVKTSKGHGLAAAESHPYRLHFSFPFDPQTGEALEAAAAQAYQDIAAGVVCDEMEQDERIVAITPSTLYATGLDDVFRRFPDRSFDPGMEEQHAMTMAVGFALGGCKPIVFYQSTFMQRAFDQLVHDVCFMNLPVLILSVRVGFSGYDSPTHHGIYDFAYTRGLPNLTLLYPKDRYELERMVRDRIRDLDGPTMIAMPYGPADAFDESALVASAASLMQPEFVIEGSDLVLIAVGHMFATARNVVDRLRAAGVAAGLVNLRRLKPLPTEALGRLASAVPRMVTLEQGVLDGGVGAAVAAFLMDNRIDCDLLRVGLPCAFVEPGSADELAQRYELDADAILRRIDERWGLAPA